MDKTTLIILICAGVFVVLVGFIILIRINNRKRFKKLQDNLKKLNQEKEDLKTDDSISLPSESEISLSSTASPIIEDYQPEIEPQPIMPDLNDNEEIYLNEFEMQDINQSLDNLSKQKDDDFEQFMNEHSYSRKIIDKPIINKIKNLPPDVRMLLLSNIFDKIDDDK